MTLPELIQRLPQMREFFTQFIELDWSLEECSTAQRACERRVWQALAKWRQENESAKKEND